MSDFFGDYVETPLKPKDQIHLQNYRTSRRVEKAKKTRETKSWVRRTLPMIIISRGKAYER